MLGMEPLSNRVSATNRFIRKPSQHQHARRAVLHAALSSVYRGAGPCGVVGWPYAFEPPREAVVEAAAVEHRRSAYVR